MGLFLSSLFYSVSYNIEEEDRKLSVKSREVRRGSWRYELIGKSDPSKSTGYTRNPKDMPQSSLRSLVTPDSGSGSLINSSAIGLAADNDIFRSHSDTGLASNVLTHLLVPYVDLG